MPGNDNGDVVANVVCKSGGSSFSEGGEETGVCCGLLHGERLIEDIEEGDKSGLVVFFFEFVMEVCALFRIHEEFEEVGVGDLIW